MTALKVLILGGTTEAAALADLLAGDIRFDTTLSLAGRTQTPRRFPIPTRVGGFGGADGLAVHLREQQIDVVVDATHPFAAVISQNALIAAQSACVPLLAIRRPPWLLTADDRWTCVATMPDAVTALGVNASNVLLTIGRQDLVPFLEAQQHCYVIRSVDPPAMASLPPRAKIILARGPFDADSERRLLQEHAIDILVTKNAGGTATVAKLTAARQLRLPVIMIDRPAKPDVPAVTTASDAIRQLERLHAQSSGTPRGL